MTHTKEWKDSWVKPNLKHGLNERGYFIHYPEGLTLGHAVDIAPLVYINARAKVHIGNNVEIGPHCMILSVSSIGQRSGEVIIGNDVQIGSHSRIMPGVTIAPGSIIKSGSYIDKDVRSKE